MAAVGKLVLVGLLFVTSVAFFRALFMYKPLPPPKACIDTPDHKRIRLKDDPMILERFKGALNIPSLSYKVHTYDGPQMTRLIDYIEQSKYAIPNLRTSKSLTIINLINAILHPRLSRNPQFAPSQERNSGKLQSFVYCSRV